MEQINARNLTVGYGKAVISDASFQLEAGEIIALIGPNGAGKSTILKTITRQLKKLLFWLMSMEVCQTSE